MRNCGSSGQAAARATACHTALLPATALGTKPSLNLSNLTPPHPAVLPADLASLPAPASAGILTFLGLHLSLLTQEAPGFSPQHHTCQS